MDEQTVTDRSCADINLSSEPAKLTAQQTKEKAVTALCFFSQTVLRSDSVCNPMWSGLESRSCKLICGQRPQGAAAEEM